MKPLTRLVPVVLLSMLGCVIAFAQPTANPATVPVPRQPWIDTHEGFSAKAKQGGIDLLFVGDSITAGWGNTGKAIWTERFAPLNAANFGIGGDKTEHVLWRLQNGNLDGMRPKVVVVMIGTNNIGRDSSGQIAEGITAVVKEINTRLPETKVLLLAVFPRSEKADHPYRAKLKETNAAIAALDDGKRVFFLDIGEKFLQPDGTLGKDIMPDGLHLSSAGYRIWADAIQAKLAELMK